MTWIGGDLLTPMRHRVEGNADQILLDRQRYWWPHCETGWCAEVPDDRLDTTEMSWCATCFPDQESNG